MKIGGKCPLSCIEDRETFLRNEIEIFYKANIDINDIESMRRIFCRNICKNLMC
jgi:hypothetical protein